MNSSIHVVCPECQATNRLPHDRLTDDPCCGTCHSRLFYGHPPELDAAAFRAHLQRCDVPFVVEFWAPWCAPCRAMAPAFERATLMLEPGIRLARVNTEEEPGLADALAVRGIPTIVAFRKGREVARHAGLLDDAALVDWILLAGAGEPLAA